MRQAATSQVECPRAGARLENGDRLTLEEFERRYQAMPHLKRAELLRGVVYMGSPVRAKSHGRPHVRVLYWLESYSLKTPGTEVYDNTSVRLGPESEPQPDAVLMLTPDRGGQARLDADDYISGAPELIVEVAASSVSYDSHLKPELYREHGVREYVLWRVLDREIDWFVSRGDAWVRLPAEGGVCRSEAFPGLWLDVAALIDDDMVRVLHVLQAGVASDEHAAFAS